MSRPTRTKAKGRREGGRFFALPISVLEHPNFIKMTAKAKALLLDVGAILRYAKGGGTSNNGDLCLTWSHMQQRGWSSKETLHNSIEELMYYGFLIKTRQGEIMRSDKPTLYALGFLGIDECEGKLEVRASAAPSDGWKRERSTFKTKRQREREDQSASTNLERS